MQIDKMIDSEPIINLVNLILFQGMSGNAAEIQIIPETDAILVRYIDGKGEPIRGITESERISAIYVYPVVVARLKTMAGLDYNNTKDPSGGKFKLNHLDKQVSLDMLTTPGDNGESLKIALTYGS